MKKLFPLLALLFAGLFFLGCSENYPTQSPDDQETVAIDAFGAEGMVADKKGGNGGGNDGGGDGGTPDPTYKVEITVPGFGTGISLAAPGDGRNIGEGEMTFTYAAPITCTGVLATPDPATGIVTIMTRQNRRSPEGFTFAQSEFFGFDTDGIHGLAFDIDHDALWSTHGENWLPAAHESVILTGGNVGEDPDRSMRLSSLQKRHPCYNEAIDAVWTINVTGN